MSTQRFEHLLTTAKQRAFDRDFLSRWDATEYWDTLVIGVSEQHPATFVVEEEDVLAYNIAVGEQHPLFIDPEFAKQHAPRGTLLVHPVFTTTVAFWFAQPPTQGSWIRTPGSRNPFQKIVFHERINIGDHLRVTQENSDRFWRRDKAYVTTQVSINDINGAPKAVCHGTLILPPDRDAVDRCVHA